MAPTKIAKGTMDLQKKLFMKKMAENVKKQPGSQEQMAMYSSEAQDQLMPLRPPSPPIHANRTLGDAPDGNDSGFPDWSDYFEHKEKFVNALGDQFNVYFTSPANKDSPLFFFHHGAGSSGMTFAELSKTLVEEFKKDKEGSESRCGVVAFDCRGHGETVVTEKDYKLETLERDAVFVLREFQTRQNAQSNSVFLIGHSLGGAVLTKACYTLVKDHKVDVKGLGMFDIVEDTAVHSLQGMHTYLSNLPRVFNSLQAAIDWHIRTGLVRNRSSAEVSVPSYFKRTDSGKYEWVIDLAETSGYWNTWFKGLSKSFVSAPTSKLLILAGTDSLDRELMIGQMQGKYQLVVFQDSGHFIQEDVPKKTAITLLDFWKRNDKKVVVIKSTWGAKK